MTLEADPIFAFKKTIETMERNNVSLVEAVREDIVTAWQHTKSTTPADSGRVSLESIVDVLAHVVNPLRPATINGLFVVAKALNLNESNACEVLSGFCNTRGFWWQDPNNKEFDNLADLLQFPRSTFSSSQRKRFTVVGILKT